MLRLNLDKTDTAPGIRSRIENIYDRIAGDDDYQRNESNLRLIQVCVITASAGATGCVNAFAHKDRIGWVGAGALAILITGFVEVFYFTLRHGLSTTYKSGMQRLSATMCYRTIQITMSLNAAVLCAWVTGLAMPPILASWNRWSIALHFILALFGVAAVRDSNPVVAHKILELKAETAKQDLITLRKAAMLGNPLVLFAAKLRGLIDGARLARELLGGKVDLPADYVGQTDEVIKGRPEQLNIWSGLYLPGASRKDAQSGDATDSSGVSESVVHPAPTGEQLGEQSLESDESGAGRVSANELGGKDRVTDERLTHEDEDRGEQLMRPSQWLKSILPEASNGWWDIRDKGNRLAIKFRWRDPDLQVITPLSIASEQLETLKQSGFEDAKSKIREQISLRLHNLSLDPARRDKALLVARKLGIDLESYQSQESANSNETDK
jgi:hypothetical protein